MRKQRRTRARRSLFWPIAGVVVLAGLAAAGLILLGRPAPEPRSVAVETHGKVMGSPAAPVAVEEWGDFQ